MVVIPIYSKKHGVKNMFIDGDDLEKIINYKLTVHNKKGSELFYVITSIKNNDKFKTVGIHRIIMQCPDGMDVDHINHNPLDNRKENLRICTRSQNIMNSRKLRNNVTSKYKGVHFQKNRKKYRSRIMVNGIRYEVGSFDKEIDALNAYNEAALKYHEKYCCISNL